VSVRTQGELFLLLYMCLYCVVYVSDVLKYCIQYYGQNCRYRGVLL
jgi:hypothetical protein